MEQTTTDSSTRTSVSVKATIPASVSDIWKYVGDPRRHVEIDGSGMIRGCLSQWPITHSNQKFTMEMLWTDGYTHYRTDNYVTVVEPERSLEWLVADEGEEPQGWRWGWVVDKVDDEHAMVTNYCDWSAVTDPDVLADKDFPVVDPREIEKTLHTLAEKLT